MVIATLNLIMGHSPALFASLPQLTTLSENAKFALWSLFAILLTILFVRPAYSFWLSLDFWIDPWLPGKPSHN